jgi:hypothetical protein
MSDAPVVQIVEGGLYWVLPGNASAPRWTVARYESGYFYEPGKDYSTTPLAISGPLTPPPNNTTKP